MFNRIKTKYIWISVVICFLLTVGLIIGVTFLKDPWNTVVIVLLAIIFIYMTVAIQVATTRSVRYKPKKVNHIIKEYNLICDNINEKIKTNGYKARIVPYGTSYIKIVGTNAYKIVVINNKDKYFEPVEEENNNKTEKGLDKCKKFIGFEIFLEYDEEVLSKLVDFNIQGNNIYYGGFYINDNKLICPNFVEPNEHFNELHKAILTDLGIVEE